MDKQTQKEQAHIMTFKFTDDQMGIFGDPDKLTKFIETRGGASGGITKIIPPPSWIPRKKNDEDLFKIIGEFTPLIQRISTEESGNLLLSSVPAKNGETVELFNLKKKISMKEKNRELHTNYSEFKGLAENFNSTSSLEQFYEDYWKNMHQGVAKLYGVDIKASLFDEETDVLNFRKLPNLIGDVQHETIDGITTPFVYIGMAGSTFAWHTKESDMYSFNYAHFGAPKHWFAIPPAEFRKFEALINRQYSEIAQNCQNLMRHKIIVMDPETIMANGITCNSVFMKDFIVIYGM